jgi:hypothetical protein
MLVQLKPGLRLRNPENPRVFFPSEPFEVGDHDFFWHRRIRDGDAMLDEWKDPEPETAAEPAAPQSPAPAPAAPKAAAAPAPAPSAAAPTPGPAAAPKSDASPAPAADPAKAASA